MGVSKEQKNRVETVCKCGCGKAFSAFPVYRSAADGGGLRVPEYIRGHHPNCRKPKPAWNKGLKKGDHPSIERMGFQPGHEPYNDWSTVNERLRTDPDFRAQWRQNKRGQVAWNRGLTRQQYANGIASGQNHGNWKGGHRGAMDTAEWQRLRREILARDSWTCQQCGDKNYRGRGSRAQLHVHHIVAVSENPLLALDPTNMVTLCLVCHYKTHNYGSKAVKRRGYQAASETG